MSPDLLAAHPEMLRQLAFADDIVLTHAGPDAAADWPARLRGINPAARLHDAGDPGFDPQALLAPGSYSGLGRPEAMAGWLAEAMAPEAGAERHGGLGSLVLTGGPARDASGWQGWLQGLAALPGMLRAKGFLAVPGAPGPLLAHVVGHRAYPLQALADWPAGVLPETRLVVIGTGLDAGALRRRFLAATTSAPGALPGLGG